MVTIQLPDLLYQELETIAIAKHSDPVTMISSWVKSVQQCSQRLQEWQLLCADVQRAGGYPKDETIDQLVERLRKTREEIFEQEYAHLYR